jgi:hypothetical protein
MNLPSVRRQIAVSPEHQVVAPDVDTAAVEIVSDRLRMPPEVVTDVLRTPPTVLRSRDAYLSKANCMEPDVAQPRYSLGTARMQRHMTDPRESYVDYLTEFDPATLKPNESEDNIRRHPTFSKYMEMSALGFEPPYISVFEHVRDDGTRVYVTANRRRTLVAQELGKPIKGWLGLHNDETGLPLKYGDVLTAYAEACARPALSADDSPAP